MPPENKPPHNQNPYAQNAADAYGQTAKKTPNQRELEGQLLLKSATALQSLINHQDEATPSDYDMALTYNRKLWTVFFDAALENTEGDRPNDLRSNIINLGNFVFKRTIEIQAERDKEQKSRKLQSLININKEIAAGLLTNPDKATTPDQQAAPPKENTAKRPLPPEKPQTQPSSSSNPISEDV